MKLFQLAQKRFALVGITSDQSIQKYPFNWKILLVSLSYGSSSVFQLLFLKQALRSANSDFMEYTDFVFVFAANIVVGICYAISIFYRSKFFAYIGNCEKIANKSM